MAGARKRVPASKPSEKQPEAPEAPQSPPPKTTSSSASSDSPIRYVSIALLAALAAGTTIYLAMYTNAFSSGLSFRERVKYMIPTPEQVELRADVPKREAVKRAFVHSWKAYEEHAYGADDYHPISKTGSNLSEAGGVGYMIVDSIDTMMLMGLDDEVDRARTWVRDKLSFDVDGELNTFELTIRVLGGLLGAHYLSENMTGTADPVYLQRAQDFGDRILSAFDTPSGLPTPSVNLAKRQGVMNENDHGLVSTAEAATLQLELKYLSHLTGDDKYWRAAENAMRVIKAASKGGLVPIMMHENGQFVASDIRLGSRGDSYYEYLLKQYLQTDRTEHVYRDLYDTSMSDINTNLIKTTSPNKLLYTAELQPKGGLQGTTWQLVPKQDHLVCFLGGSLLLGVTEGGGPVPPDVANFNAAELRDWTNGIGIIKTCMETHKTLTGLAPEIAHFRTPTDPQWVAEAAPKDWYIKGMKGHEGDTYDARYMLRPETVESLYIAHRITGHPQFRRWGWQIFQAIEKHCKIPAGGYATVLNVDHKTVKHEDKMETFFMSETLKYLYLLFDDAERVSLEDVVFNTEAHILPVFHPTLDTRV